MTSSDVGAYEFKQSPCMQMEECSAHLARSTSDGSADNNKRNSNSDNSNNNKNKSNNSNSNKHKMSNSNNNNNNNAINFVY